MTDAMTRPMVPDAEAAGWADDSEKLARIADATPMEHASAWRIKRLLADRERWMEVVEQAQRAFLFLIDDGLGMDSRIVDEALAATTELLKEAHDA